jgi:hypothetical protein|tara:strand:+ start:744 stop:1025 length:282 start_codon:yes stop_codon:yes gene_type:complete
MAKKEKVLDLKPEKITDEQLKKLQETVNTINRTQLDLGAAELQKHDLMHKVARLRDSIAVMQNEFEKEYGTYDINIQDGTINYQDNGEVNKKN